MVSTKFIEECRNPAYKNRLGKVQLGDSLFYLTVQDELKISNDLKVSAEPTNVDKSYSCLSEISLNDSCYSNGSIIGTTISKNVTVKVNDIRDYIENNFIANIGVKYSDNTTEYINLGNYITQSQTVDKTSKNTTINGLDKLYKLDEMYDCSITNWTNVTIKDLLVDLCNNLGIELGTESFLNEDILVSGNHYQKNYKYRDVLSDICEIGCCWAELDEDNKLYLKWFSDIIVDILDKSQYSILEKNKEYGEVNSLVIKDSAFEGENVAIQDDESISLYGETQIAIIDNNLLNTEQLRQQAITSIWERIKGFKYVDCKIVSYYGKPFLKRGDKIRVEDVDGIYFETYVLNHNFKYDGAFYSEISSPSVTKEQTKIKNTNLSPKQRIVNAEAQVLKNEGKIILLTEKQEEMTSDLEENYYTKTTTNELINDVSKGVINKYTVGGGNNIFRNTGLHFESSNYSSGFDYWEGIVSKKNNNDSKSRTSMLLQNGSLKQRQEVPNDLYTISFEYIKLNELTNGSVVINDIEYLLNDNGKFSQTIEVKTAELVIEFKCDINNGYEIYELMANYGEVALTYSQNANEIKTDTVEISEGIKITSSATDSVFKANADGIRTENKFGDTTTEFLDTGMKTNKLEAEQGLIAQLLVQEVDGQTWISALGR